jgi:hypothetical protein
MKNCLDINIFVYIRDVWGPPQLKYSIRGLFQYLNIFAIASIDMADQLKSAYPKPAEATPHSSHPIFIKLNFNNVLQSSHNYVPFQYTFNCY